ncbi:MAG TPA: DUF4230 domain-containing protein [Anaerolineae bacterium]|nr:DUF4230 domain-containing protein [Anaerolineae bacterium]HQH36919.1 DUF4230 domain-containing protein [Anaerolineae bacterium]
MPQPSRPPTRRPPPRPARPASPRGAPTGRSTSTDVTPYLRWGGAIVLTLIVVAAGFGLCSQSEKLLALVNNIVNPPPKITPLQVMVQVRSASELTTAIVETEVVTKVDQENDPILFVIPNKPTQLIYKGHGEVRAGFDLTRITEDSITIQGRKVILTLPPPQILSKGLDADQSGIYDLDTPWLGELDPNTVNTAQQNAMVLIMEQACAQDILGKANQNAEVEFARLLSTLAFEEVEVITQPGTDCK